jgi:tripartite-type tricarboxylate transporter receptor subunit TctC
VKRYLAILAFSLVAILGVACSQATASSSPAPTAAPAAKAATAAPAAQATSPAAPAAQATSPAKAVNFPEKNKSVTLVVPFDVGGGTDISSRVLAPYLEKELGVPVQVVNKPGASGQVGITEVATSSKPDGYTLGYTSLPQGPIYYLDPEKKASFARKDMQQVALYNSEPLLIAVKADSPFKTLKDVVDAAKATPEKVKATTTGVLGIPHLGILQMEQASGAKFAAVHFDSSGKALLALLGDNVDVHFGWNAELQPQVKAGAVRVLAVLSKEASKYYPEAKTAEAQGYKVYCNADRGWIVRGGTPPEIVDILSSAIKRAMNNEEVKKKMDDLGFPLKYMDAKEFTAYWDQSEQEIKPLLEQYKKQ